MKGLLVCLGLLFYNLSVQAQQLTNTGMQPAAKEHLFMQSKAKYIAAPESKGTARITSGTGIVFDTSKWVHRIDSTWGGGLSDTAKLNLFNEFWMQVDSFYAGFVGLPAYNWDSIVNAMRTEISDSVSEGRFEGIIGNLLGYLNDGHTDFYNSTINYGSAIYLSLPVFRGESGLFGACITTVNDTSAMVYTVDPGHPFGLQAGDIILGYNNIPWTKLIPILLQYQLPTSIGKGSSDAATYHRLIQAAGENWYLFDTINIKKCDGSIVNLPTSLMIGKSVHDLCTEEMQVPGIHKLTYTDYFLNNRIICSGVITGTRVGYVSMIDCSDGSGDSLYNAVKILMEDSLVDGLIMDIRANYGGTYNAFERTFMYLNAGESAISWLGAGDRVSPSNKLLMYNAEPTSWYDFTDTIPGAFHKKIAILCGPGALSAGDLLSVLFKHDTDVKTFGKSTTGAFGGYIPLTITYPNYYASRQGGNFYQASDTTHYLTHTSFPVDSAVWYSQASVCDGVDNILKTAIDWIEPQLAGVNNSQTITKPSISVYPNPANETVTISGNNISADNVTIQIMDITGRILLQKVANTYNQNLNASFDIKALSSGMYFVTLTTETQKFATKIVKE
jgi:hypothetical protein